jgi:hypothetical protein
MESHINVLFHSKFSEPCKRILDIVRGIPLLQEATILVCVDNKEVREKIMMDGSLKINTVPCFMRIYDDSGYIESFEGERAFEVIESYIPPPTPHTPPTPPTPPTQDYLKPTIVGGGVDNSPRQFTSIENIEKSRPADDNVAVGTYLYVPRTSEDPQIMLEREIQEKMVKPRAPQNITSLASMMEKERNALIDESKRDPRHNRTDPVFNNKTPV